MNQKAQIMVLDILVFSLCVVFVIYFEVLFIEIYGTEQTIARSETNRLEELLFVDKLVSDCNYLAQSAINHQSLCYQNVLDISRIGYLKTELSDNGICRIKISGNIIYQKEEKEITKTLERGVIINGNFEIMEFTICR